MATALSRVMRLSRGTGSCAHLDSEQEGVAVMHDQASPEAEGARHDNLHSMCRPFASFPTGACHGLLNGICAAGFTGSPGQ